MNLFHSVFHSVNKYKVLSAMLFYFISTFFLVGFIFIRVFSGINVYFPCGLWIVLCFSYVGFNDSTKTDNQKHCIHNRDSARARKSCDDPNNVTSKCLFNIVSNARTFRTDEALKEFQVSCRSTTLIGEYKIQDFLYVLWGNFRWHYPTSDRITFSEKLNGSTEAARRLRHKIMFNQHLPFEQLAFH